MPESDFMELCRTAEEKAGETEDVLLTQAPSSATQLLLDTIFIRYSLIIMANLTRNIFSIPNLMAAHDRGDKCVSVITRQLGDDGVYRKVESTDYFVKNPSVDDVLVISLCHNID